MAPRMTTDPVQTPSASTHGVHISRSGCIEEAAHLLAGCFRRLDEAQAKRTAPSTSAEGRSRAGGALLAGDPATTSEGAPREGAATTRKVPA